MKRIEQGFGSRYRNPYDEYGEYDDRQKQTNA